MADLKRTPLFHLYKEGGAKTIDFGGWDLPVQFLSIKEEHEAVRTKAGLFDVSHMGEVEVKGPRALDYLQKLMTNDVSKLVDGQAQYTAMCYEDGGTVDDLLIYRKAEDDYLLVINASNIEKDVEWMQQHIIEGVTAINVSSDIAQLAIQGPIAEQILQKRTSFDLSSIRFFRFADQVNVDGVDALVSRTGYTGEDGFELYCAADQAAKLWKSLLEAGKEDGLVPCGLGARDTLRFEARLPLYGQELTKEISPLEAGIGFAVKVNKDADFIGKEALKKQKEEGLKRKLVGLEMIDKGIPRTGYEVFVGDKLVGFVTTGTQSPTLKKNVGLAVLDIDVTALGTEVEVQVRKKRLKAQVVSTPFYKK
ncbi:glycine cleavage system aminomethyltransferase GcvT [Halalkalibacter alkaliphilus]|uniref:Aminomethyltransferase n=1 Tax=Halalkalibacter alkaliphilus TaxID=2917993 RepID=A0A9X2CXG5_9BACI|nr:glycine cleavage system aminomethyltransferase GcvT [Halalkalibacter alkaliphilus]MCL7749855.1 glycine cleavage system aminomethyltransferase GcvT [Halalkalibacter alkaliphilus]